jgi:hypothetical protein
MTTSAWTCGTLRENYDSLTVGSVVFYRRVTTSRPMAAGVCYWIKPPGKSVFYNIAESYGGPNLRDMVLPTRSKTGKVLESPSEVSLTLNQDLRKWQASLPAGSRPYSDGSKACHHKPITKVKL